VSLKEILRVLFAWGPLWFGVGFVAPVLAQSMDRFAVTPPMGLTTMQAGLVAGLLLGSVARLRGRWV